jgi:hypothetical protein
MTVMSIFIVSCLIQADVRPSFAEIGEILLDQSIFNFVFEVNESLGFGKLEA